MKNKSILGCFIGLLLGFSVNAQQEIMLNSLQDVWHSNATNPAFFPANKRYVLGMPSYGLDAAHSGSLTYKDIFIKDGDRTFINFGNAIDQLDPSNELHFDQRFETVSLGFRLGKIRLQAGHANRFTGTVTYPKSLPELLWNGNGPYVGKEVDVALKTQIFDWNEWSVGTSIELGPLEIGGRFKYLSGITALRTDPDHSTANLYTNPDIYQLTMKTDYGFYSSSIISAIDTSGLGFDLTLTNLKGKLFSANRGTALDLGGRLKIGERLTLSFSALDIGGKIEWKKNAQYFLSKGSYEYSGVSFPGIDIINGADSIDFETKLDTLNDIFKFNKTAQNFSTTLPSRYYANVAFQLTKRVGLGLSVFVQQGEEDLTAVGATVRWMPLKWLSVGGVYSVNDRSATNVGFHIVLKPGPVQFYFMSDNLVNAFTIKSSSAANLRLGASMAL